METDDPQQRLLLLHAVADEELHRREGVAGDEVLVESEDVVLQAEDERQVPQGGGDQGRRGGGEVEGGLQEDEQWPRWRMMDVC